MRSCERPLRPEDATVPPTTTAADRARVYLESIRRQVDAALDQVLPAENVGAPRLAEAMRYSVFAGGKRLRPALALAACRAVGGEDVQALPFACALELVHTYSLIHDDLPAMDDDDLRRGKPTSHKVYGDAMAILAGDALHTAAFQVIALGVQDRPLCAELMALLANTAGFHGMVGGQVEDLAGDREAPNAERLRRIHMNKTAALIRASICGGALSAGASAEVVKALAAFGDRLGLAFQITDDILDETGTAESLGKTPGKDRQDGKLTYVALEGLDGAIVRADAARAESLAALDRVPAPFSKSLLADLAEFVTARTG